MRMSNYTIETWTIREVANAFNYYNNDSDDENAKKVVIPIFQRGLRWSPDKRRAFIDSLEKGFPFGSLLFSKQDGINKYSVVDGLQRGSTVCDFVLNPLAKNNITKIDDDVLNAVRLSLFPGNNNYTINNEIQSDILKYLYNKKRFENIEVADLADIIFDKYTNDQDYRLCTTKIRESIKPFIEKLKKNYDEICSASVPIVVYSGKQELLNEIFQRINKNGIPLNDYEIYAATWSQKKIPVKKDEIINRVINKYLVLVKAGYIVDGFDATLMLREKQLTAFEYLFGLGKYWRDQFECLKIDSNEKEDDVNEISFEIVDACISSTKSISTLDQNLQKLNVNKLQRRIEEAIEFVSKSISVVSSFKGNKRKFNVLHSKYQIVSLIAFTFKEMYSLDNLDAKKKSWDENSKQISKRLLEHYVSDIIDTEWHDGGGAKVYTYVKERKYVEEITKSRWEVILDNYFQNQLQNKDNERIRNPVNSDSVILNCVYANIFSANDQLSTKKFDIEHLATKERMKKLMKQYSELKLPISCIGNLCYLPEDINRGKKEKTIYEANQLSLPLQTIEEKFSFTSYNDLEWIEYDYDPNNLEDMRLLEKSYLSFIEKRFALIKKKFISFFFNENND